MSRVVPIILCGGSGTRLWPRSRAEKPKPFIPLLGENTLFQATLTRCSDPQIFAPPVIVIGEAHLPFAEEQAKAISPEARFIVEPVGRNTAPAIALAAQAVDPSDIMLVCPSDHHIRQTRVFVEAARSAATLAAEGWLVAFGIEATAPETGYGYIRRGEALSTGYRVDSFVEKPNLETALKFLDDGRYAWNGGIFAFQASVFLQELAEYRPEMSKLVTKAFGGANSDGRLVRPEPESFGAIKGESVDYALMENTRKAATIDAAMGWSDIGNWDSLLRQRASANESNVIVGPGEIIAATGSMIDSDRQHVTVIGVDNVVVVVDRDDILVTARNAVQKVGEARRCKS